MPLWTRILLSVTVVLSTVFSFYKLSQPVVVSCEYKLFSGSETPQTALCSLTTRKPVKVKGLVIAGVGSYPVETRLGLYHEVNVLGLPAGRSSEVHLTLEDESGRRFDSPSATLKTPALPPEMPKFQVSVLGPNAPGFVLHSIGRKVPYPLSFDVITDRFGQVVWYRRQNAHTLVTRLLENGRLMTLWPLSGELERLDVRGRMLTTYDFKQPASQLKLDGRLDIRWILGAGRLALLDLRNRKLHSVELVSLLGEGFEFSGFSVNHNGQRVVLAWAGGQCLIGLNIASGVEWVFGEPEKWYQYINAPLLNRVEGTEWPFTPAQVLWSRNDGVLTIEVQGESAYLREYLVDLDKLTGQMMWSHEMSLAGRKWRSVMLGEGGSGDVCIIGEDFEPAPGFTQFARVIQVLKGERNQLISELQLHTADEVSDWKLNSVQLVRSPYGY